TLYEWKEDVIRPRLMMTKLCRGRVHVTDEDLRMAYEAYHGEKVRCQMIMWPKSEHQIALKEYAEISKSEDAFDHKARTQCSPRLCAVKGLMEPFGRHTTGNEDLEKEAFRLRPGEVSPIMETPEGYVVVKLVKKIQPDGAKLEACRAELEREIMER